MKHPKLNLLSRIVCRVIKKNIYIYNTISQNYTLDIFADKICYININQGVVTNVWKNLVLSFENIPYTKFMQYQLQQMDEEINMIIKLSIIKIIINYLKNNELDELAEQNLLSCNWHNIQSLDQYIHKFVYSRTHHPLSFFNDMFKWDVNEPHKYFWHNHALSLNMEIMNYLLK